LLPGTQHTVSADYQVSQGWVGMMILLLTFELCVHCFNAVIAMVGVDGDNQFACVKPPHFIRNNVTMI
jgi:hypothetical protein